MRHRNLSIALCALSLGVVSVVVVAWQLSQRRVPRPRQDVAPSEHNEASQRPEVHENPTPAAVVPLLKPRSEPASKDGFYDKLPAIDLDKFGDITPDLYHVKYESFMRLVRAQEAGRPQNELTELQQGLARESEEFMRQHFPEAYRLFSEGKPEWVEKLSEEQTRKGGDRYGLISAVMLARSALATLADFHLAGVIVDEDGRSCPDVTIKLSKETVGVNPNGWPTNEYYAGSISAAGSFALKVDRASSVELNFHKPGYYSVRNLRFAAPEPSSVRKWEIELAGKRMPPQQVVKDGLAIVMEKQGKLTLLRSGGATLEFQPDGTGDVLKIGVNADGHWFMQGTREADISIRPPKHLPEKCVYAVTKTDDKGRLVLMKLSALRSRRARSAKEGAKPEAIATIVPDDESQYVYAPTEVRLLVSDPQGGFIRYEPKPDREIRPDRPWTRDMKQAPEQGYQHELVLNSEAIKKLFANPDEPQPVYFYIKAFGKFGKGQLSLKIMLKEAQRKYVNGQLEPIRYLLDEAGLAVPVQILMQPDGSRNLEGYE